MIHLVQPDSPALWAVARHLVEAYAASLDIDLGFQDFQNEITSLQRTYGPPAGVFLYGIADWHGVKRQAALVKRCGLFFSPA